MIHDYIPRPEYAKRIAPFIGADIIKVFVGQRRVGKSHVMYQTMDEVRRRDESVQIVYINLELHEFHHLRTHQQLIGHIREQWDGARRAAIFIDEIQEISSFEKSLRGLLAGGNCDVYCTGSNAQLLGGELATLLTGRCIEIPIHGLSYREFMQFHGRSDSDDTLGEYMRFGGLPWLRNVALSQEVVDDYLRTVLNAVVLKDVVARHGIRNVDFLQRLTEYVAGSIGSIVSAKSISDFLKSQHIRTSPNVVMNYLSHLADAFLVYRVSRADVRGKKVFEIGQKYYFEDLGLRNALVGYGPTEAGKALENMVFMHLTRAGYDVHVGKDGNREIDFVARKAGGKTVYVQAAWLLSQQDTVEREFGNLLAIPDNYPKYVVSMSPLAGGDHKGIRSMHVRQFLKEDL